MSHPDDFDPYEFDDEFFDQTNDDYDNGQIHFNNPFLFESSLQTSHSNIENTPHNSSLNTNHSTQVNNNQINVDTIINQPQHHQTQDNQQHTTNNNHEQFLDSITEVTIESNFDVTVQGSRLRGKLIPKGLPRGGTSLQPSFSTNTHLNNNSNNYQNDHAGNTIALNQTKSHHDDTSHVLPDSPLIIPQSELFISQFIIDDNHYTSPTSVFPPLTKQQSQPQQSQQHQQSQLISPTTRAITSDSTNPISTTVTTIPPITTTTTSSNTVKNDPNLILQPSLSNHTPKSPQPPTSPVPSTTSSQISFLSALSDSTSPSSLSGISLSHTTTDDFDQYRHSSNNNDNDLTPLKFAASHAQIAQYFFFIPEELSTSIQLFKQYQIPKSIQFKINNKLLPSSPSSQQKEQLGSSLNTKLQSPSFHQLISNYSPQFQLYSTQLDSITSFNLYFQQYTNHYINLRPTIDPHKSLLNCIISTPDTPNEYILQMKQLIIEAYRNRLLQLQDIKHQKVIQLAQQQAKNNTSCTFIQSEIDLIYLMVENHIKRYIRPDRIGFIPPLSNLNYDSTISSIPLSLNHNKIKMRNPSSSSSSSSSTNLSSSTASTVSTQSKTNGNDLNQTSPIVQLPQHSTLLPNFSIQSEPHQQSFQLSQHAHSVPQLQDQQQLLQQPQQPQIVTQIIQQMRTMPNGLAHFPPSDEIEISTPITTYQAISQLHSSSQDYFESPYLQSIYQLYSDQLEEESKYNEQYYSQQYNNNNTNSNAYFNDSDDEFQSMFDNDYDNVLDSCQEWSSQPLLYSIPIRVDDEHYDTYQNDGQQLSFLPQSDTTPIQSERLNVANTLLLESLHKQYVSASINNSNSNIATSVTNNINNIPNPSNTEKIFINPHLQNNSNVHVKNTVSHNNNNSNFTPLQTNQRINTTISPIPNNNSNSYTPIQSSSLSIPTRNQSTFVSLPLPEVHKILAPLYKEKNPLEQFTTRLYTTLVQEIQRYYIVREYFSRAMYTPTFFPHDGLLCSKHHDFDSRLYEFHNFCHESDYYFERYLSNYILFQQQKHSQRFQPNVNLKPSIHDQLHSPPTSIITETNNRNVYNNLTISIDSNNSSFDATLYDSKTVSHSFTILPLPQLLTLVVRRTKGDVLIELRQTLTDLANQNFLQTMKSLLFSKDISTFPELVSFPRALQSFDPDLPHNLPFFIPFTIQMLTAQDKTNQENEQQLPQINSQLLQHHQNSINNNSTDVTYTIGSKIDFFTLISLQRHISMVYSWLTNISQRHTNSTSHYTIDLNHTCGRDLLQNYHSLKNKGTITHQRRDEAALIKHNYQNKLHQLITLHQNYQQQLDQRLNPYKQHNNNNNNNTNTNVTKNRTNSKFGFNRNFHTNTNNNNNDRHYSRTSTDDGDESEEISTSSTTTTPTQWFENTDTYSTSFPRLLAEGKPCQLCDLIQLPFGGVLHCLKDLNPSWFSTFFQLPGLPETEKAYVKDSSVTYTPSCHQNQNFNNQYSIDSFETPDYSGDFFHQLICQLLSLTSRVTPTILDTIEGCGWFIPTTINLKRSLVLLDNQLALETALLQQHNTNLLHNNSTHPQSKQYPQFQLKTSSSSSSSHDQLHGNSFLQDQPFTLSNNNSNPQFRSIDSLQTVPITTQSRYSNRKPILNQIFTVIHLYELIMHNVNMNQWLCQFLQHNQLLPLPQDQYPFANQVFPHLTLSSTNASSPLRGLFSIPQFPTFIHPTPNTLFTNPTPNSIIPNIIPHQFLISNDPRSNFQFFLQSHHPSSNYNFPLPHSHYNCLCETILWYHAYYSSHPVELFNSGWRLNPDFHYDLSTHTYQVHTIPKSILVIDGSYNSINSENKSHSGSFSSSGSLSIGNGSISIPNLNQQQQSNQISTSSSIPSNSLQHSIQQRPQHEYLIHSLKDKRPQFFTQRPPQLGFCQCFQCLGTPVKVCLLCALPTFKYLHSLSIPSVYQPKESTASIQASSQSQYYDLPSSTNTQNPTALGDSGFQPTPLQF